jgi:ATP-binding cassette subfamily A (ABC1) protein 3
MDVFQNVGICPQFDSIYDNLTVVEHLKYFAQLKGNNSEVATKLVNYYLKIMQLDEYAKIKAGKLSGGNKRKLSVSMALIGNPKMMFFD